MFWEARRGAIMLFHNQHRYSVVTLSEAKGLSRWAESCFASLSRTVPILNGKIHNCAPTHGVYGSERLSLGGFGTGNECANNGDDSDHEEQRGVLIMCARGKAAKCQRMVHAGNQIIHSQHSSNDSYRNRAI